MASTTTCSHHTYTTCHSGDRDQRRYTQDRVRGSRLAQWHCQCSWVCVHVLAAQGCVSLRLAHSIGCLQGDGGKMHGCQEYQIVPADLWHRPQRHFHSVQPR